MDSRTSYQFDCWIRNNSPRILTTSQAETITTKHTLVGQNTINQGHGQLLSSFVLSTIDGQQSCNQD